MANVISMKQILTQTIYIGVFTPTLRVEGKLKNEVKDPHITLKFRPNEDEIKNVLFSGQGYTEVYLKNYKLSSDNEGLGVTIKNESLPLWKEVKNPHITLSWSDNSTPVKTGGLIFDEEVPQKYTSQLQEAWWDPYCCPPYIGGNIGFFLKGGTIIYLDDLMKTSEEYNTPYGVLKTIKIFDEELFFIEDEDSLVKITKEKYLELKEEF